MYRIELNSDSFKIAKVLYSTTCPQAFIENVRFYLKNIGWHTALTKVNLFILCIDSTLLCDHTDQFV